MFDNNAMLRAASAGALSADELTPVFQNVGADLEVKTYMVSVPSVAGTTPTLDVTIQDSKDGTNANESMKFPQITAAGVYYIRAKFTGPYRRAVCDVGGTTPNFGIVEIGPVPAGRYDKI